jgi:hypothetical protein
LPAVRGIIRSRDDEIRADVIHRLNAAVSAFELERGRDPVAGLELVRAVGLPMGVEVDETRSHDEPARVHESPARFQPRGEGSLGNRPDGTGGDADVSLSVEAGLGIQNPSAGEDDVEILLRRADPDGHEKTGHDGPNVWGAGTPGPENPYCTVVGVVGDVRHRAFDAGEGVELYYPYMQYPVRNVYYVVRTEGDPQRSAASVRRAIEGVSADAGIVFTKTMEQLIVESLWQQRLWGVLLSIFAALAVALAAVGIYGGPPRTKSAPRNRVPVGFSFR